MSEQAKSPPAVSPELLLQAAELPWRPKSLDGVHEKALWRDEETGASIALIKIEKDSGIPELHTHASNQFMFMLRGKYEYLHSGEVLTEGSFYWNPKGNAHGPTVAREESVFVEIFDGPHYPQMPNWYTDEQDAR